MSSAFIYVFLYLSWIKDWLPFVPLVSFISEDFHPWTLKLKLIQSSPTPCHLKSLPLLSSLNDLCVSRWQELVACLSRQQSCLSSNPFKPWQGLHWGHNWRATHVNHIHVRMQNFTWNNNSELGNCCYGKMQKFYYWGHKWRATPVWAGATIFTSVCKTLSPRCFKKQNGSRPRQRQAWVGLT